MDEHTKRLLNEPYMWREHEVGDTMGAVCPVCGAFTLERFVHADWHKQQSAWVDWNTESGSTSLAALAFLLLALVPVGLAVSAVASLAGAVAGVA